jgi:hypothetical protein
MKLELRLDIEVGEMASVQDMRSIILTDVVNWLHSPPIMAKLNGFADAAKDTPERVMAHG